MNPAGAASVGPVAGPPLSRRPTRRRRILPRRILPRRRDPHDREILRLAVPAFGALVAEPLFLLTDTAVVGRLGTPELAGVGIAAAVLGSIVSICVFLAYGTTAAVARRLGAGDRPGALRQGIDGMWLGLGLGVVLAAGTAAAAGPLVRALGASASAEPYAVGYLRISTLGIPAVLLVLAATGVLRGLQDTRTPLVVAVVGAVVNAVLSVVLVHPVGLGVEGSAIGTVLVQTGSAAAYLVVVGRGARAAGTGLAPDRAGVVASARAGLPLVVRTVTLRAALLLTTWVAARSGDVAVASHQIAFAVWSLLALALDALAIAGQALTGRALGAGAVRELRGTLRRMLEWGVGGGAVLGALIVATQWLWVPVFSTDQRVRDQLLTVLVVVALLQPLAGAVFVLDGVLIGAGDGRYLAVAGVLTLLAYVPLALLVAGTGGGLVALWWAFGGWMLARLVTLLARARGDRWIVTGADR